MFSGTTNSRGQFRAKLLNAPSGRYQSQVPNLTHSGLTWAPGLDVAGANPSTLTK